MVPYATSGTEANMSMERRDFLKFSGISALAYGTTWLNATAAITEAYVPGKYAELIPPDKGLDPEWVRSLTTRGEPRRYTDEKALAHIGMPVGGLFAGMVYLGGDGRLCLWNIFNHEQLGVSTQNVTYRGTKLDAMGGSNYIAPPPHQYPFDQNFCLRINGKTRTMDANGFKKVSFNGQYPIGNVTYEDSECPVSVTLAAYSPFIPLNTPDSSLPATVMSYTLRNTGTADVTTDVIGWMANPICLNHGKTVSGIRKNAIVDDKQFTALSCSAAAMTDTKVSASEGKNAKIQIVDNETGGKIDDLPDFGSMTLTVLTEKGDVVLAAADSREPLAAAKSEQDASVGLTGELPGSVGKQVTLTPGEEKSVDFLITWHFPNLSIRKMGNVGREYAARFENALGVARYLVKDFKRLSGDTKLWRDTWYDSTLPYWFLDRTMANTSILATTTVYRFKTGRFWAWEGIGCCHGTCTHVWHYAQAPGRLFPDVERRHRGEVDFGLAEHLDGGIGMRLDLNGANHPADDGQCGRILGAYREHQMSPDDAILKQTWPRIKQAILFMIKRDANRDGIIEGAQHNTLDAAWYGRISFLASLYIAMLRAGEAMANEMGDTAFAGQCRQIADRGSKTIEELYNGEYFFHELDKQHIDDVAVGTGCYIDQVFGQFWAHQVGLGHVFDPQKIKSALSSLYKYNFVPNVGKFRETFTRGRWYASDNDKGLIMCSWPKGGLNEKWHKAWQFMYFNECMTGFEWQAAAHMIAEGLVGEGLAVSRAIHDRYDASLRNPYNEIECSDHYSRAMASYGAFLSACGYAFHGPKGHIAFAPRLSPENFRAPFTTAEGWGTFTQKIADGTQTETLELRIGRLILRTLSFSGKAKSVQVTVNGKAMPATLGTSGDSLNVAMKDTLTLGTSDILVVQLVQT